MARVLIADQSPVLARELAVACQSAGLAVVGIARDGLGAVEQAARLRPTHLVLDLLLPRLGGAQVLATLRRQAVPVVAVVVSAVTARESILGARQAGATAYLLKPIAVPRLIEVLTAQRNEPAAVAAVQ